MTTHTAAPRPGDPHALRMPSFRRNVPGEDSTESRLPLVLGVSGHIDLREEDLPELRAAISRVLDELRDSAPHTPLVLISPLAEGADRLVAEIFCEQTDGELVCPLPLPKEEYERDFSTVASRQAFNEYLEKAAAWFELPQSHEFTSERLREADCRNQQYEHVGRYIAHHCHILLALWNGQETDSTGGTYQIVRMKLQTPWGDAETSSGRRLLDPPEPGPVVHIVTPRRAGAVTHGKPFEVQWMFPLPLESGGNADIDWRRPAPAEVRHAYEAIVERIDGFNEDCIHMHGPLASQVVKCKEWLIPQQDQRSLSVPSQSLLHHFAVADALAIKYAKSTRQTLRWLFVLAAIAMVLFEFCAHLFLLPHAPEWLVAWGLAPFAFCAYLPIWIAAFLLAWRAEHGEFQNRFQDYRALAEGMRVQFFWMLAGVTDPTEDSYLRNQRGELDWIRYAIRTRRWQAQLDSKEPDGQDRSALVISGWVRDQREWFGRNGPKEANSARRRRFWGGAAFVLALFAAAILTGLILYYEIRDHGAHGAHDPHGPAWHEWADWLLIASGSLVIVGALVIAYAEKLAVAEHARQYKAMHRLFTSALVALETKKLSLQERNDLLRELGKDALSENGSWLLMHRERPLEVPVP